MKQVVFAWTLGLMLLAPRMRNLWLWTELWLGIRLWLPALLWRVCLSLPMRYGWLLWKARRLRLARRLGGPWLGRWRLAALTCLM